MTNQPGDRAYGHGDDVTRQNSTGVELGAGLWVSPTGDENVALADSSAGRDHLVGHTAYPIADSKKGDVRLRGVTWARVASGTNADAELRAPDSSVSGEEAGVAASGGSSGIYTLTDAKDPDGDGKFVAQVLMR